MGQIVGTNRRGMGSQVHGLIDYKVVLVKGEANDYAAYIGSGSDEWVAANGDKLQSRKEVEVHFPDFPEEWILRG